MKSTIHANFLKLFMFLFFLCCPSWTGAQEVNPGVCDGCDAELIEAGSQSDLRDTYPIMRPNRETLERWFQQYETAVRFSIDDTVMGFPPRGSKSLLNHLPYTPAQRQQGVCGNCWAWAATGVMEIDHSVRQGVSDRLSVQYITSCQTSRFACCGGNLSDFTTFYSSRGHVLPWSNTNAAYGDANTPCSAGSSSVACGSIGTSPNYPVNSISPVTITTTGVSQAQAIANIKATLNANKAIQFSYWLPDNAAWNDHYAFWNGHGETALWDPSPYCNRTWIDNQGGGHGVVLVGYNDDDPNPDNHYWIAVNSWGTASGGRPNGIFRLKMNINYQCTFLGFSWPIVQFQTLNITWGSTPPPPPPPSEAWKTEIGIVNMASATTSGVLRGFNSSGTQVWSQNVSLPPLGRTSMDVTQAAGSATSSQIKSMRLDITSGAAVGYQKFYQAGKYRVGLEALPRPNQSGMYLPHIHSDNHWWTGVGLVNTTSGAKNLGITFSNGAQASRSVSAGGHDSFLINGPFQGSATVSNGAGVAGLLLFGTIDERQLSGVSLSDNAAHTLIFPHVEQNGWWTGVGMYNPNSTTASLTMNTYDTHGNHLGSNTYSIDPYGNFVRPTGFSNPNTAWFTVTSPSVPIIGFELFGTTDGNQLAGYSVVDLATPQGVFPKLETSGWTGIALVNATGSAASVTLEARNNAGTVVASRSLSLNPGQKEVKEAQNFFTSSIASATYVRFTSTQPLVGFQLNGSGDNTMLDAIPALGSTANYGTSTLYFPHIDAQ